MMFTHYGLIFTSAHIETAHENKDEAPFHHAWSFLNNHQLQSDIDQLLINAWRYRLLDNTNAGDFVINDFRINYAWGSVDQQAESVIAQSKAFFALSQAYELARIHPDLADLAWLNGYRQKFDALPVPDESDIISGLWYSVARMAAGVVLEDQALIEASAEHFRQTISTEIHPEGNFRTAVKVDPESQSLTNQVFGTQALVLMAEMAEHIGLDLWGYQDRGVSALTPATYTTFYFFYPDQWRWNGSEFRPSEGVSHEFGASLFKNNAGFLEIISRRYDKPFKAGSMALDTLRPVYDVYGGGLTTLTHAIPSKPNRNRRRWLF
jgi:hypothetical protein